MEPERMNQVIHEQIRGLCWHERQKFPIHKDWVYSKNPDTSSYCIRCKQSVDLKAFSMPSYTTDLNAVALAEAKVIDGDWKKSISLATCIAIVLSDREMTAFATAHQRAEALLKHEGLWEADDD